MNAIEIKELIWKYSNTPSPSLDGIDLAIEEGSTIGIVGPNESGKTTLVYAISGLIPHSFNGVLKGSVHLFGNNVMDMSASALAADVGLVFADPEAQFTAMTVEEEIVFGMENLGFSLEEIDEQLRRVAELTGIEALLDKSPYDISGGQKQRVAIAAVLAMKPRILILDEPTSMIDPVGKADIFGIMRRLKEEAGLTILIVEHNLEELAMITDRMIMVYDGQIVRDAPTQEFFYDADFLREHGLAVPEVAAVFDGLTADGLYRGPLPLDVEAGSKYARLLLDEGE